MCNVCRLVHMPQRLETDKDTVLNLNAAEIATQQIDKYSAELARI